MRLAVTILALFLMVIVGAQSCTVAFGGALTSDEGLSSGGGVGIFVAILFLIGGAFAMAFPFVSLGSFVLAAVMSLAVGVASSFSDMLFWFFVSLVLATMSFFGAREKRRSQARNRVE